MPSLPPQHVFQWLRECFAPQQPQARIKVTSVPNYSIHQMHSGRLGQNPFIPQDLKPTDANKHHHYYPRQQSILSVCDYVCSVPFSREYPVKQHAYWIPFPNNTWLTAFESSPLAHFFCFTVGITCLYHKSFFLRGVCQRQHSSRHIYSIQSHAAKKTKTRLEPVKPPSAIPSSDHRQVPWYSPILTAAGPHTSAWLSLTKELCVPPGWCARFVQHTLHLHRKSRHKNRFSSSAGFILPIFRPLQFWPLASTAVPALPLHCPDTRHSLPRQR